MQAFQRSWCPDVFHPSTKRRLYRLLSSGEIGAPCGVRIQTRRTAEGQYDLSFSSFWSSPSHWSSPYALLLCWLCSIRRRGPERPGGTPCRTARRTGSPAIPSLWHAARSATSERFPEGLDSLSISCGPLSLRSLLLQLRSLPSTVVTRFIGTTDLSVIPCDPDCPSRAAGLKGAGFGSRPIAGTSRVDAGVLAR